MNHSRISISLQQGGSQSLLVTQGTPRARRVSHGHQRAKMASESRAHADSTAELANTHLVLDYKDRSKLIPRPKTFKVCSKDSNLLSTKTLLTVHPITSRRLSMALERPLVLWEAHNSVYKLLLFRSTVTDVLT